MEMAFREFRSYPVLKANQVVGTVLSSAASSPACR
jgi:hypothetical protein